MHINLCFSLLKKRVNGEVGRGCRMMNGRESGPRDQVRSIQAIFPLFFKEGQRVDMWIYEAIK